VVPIRTLVDETIEKLADNAKSGARGFVAWRAANLPSSSQHLLASEKFMSPTITFMAANWLSLKHAKYTYLSLYTEYLDKEEPTECLYKPYSDLLTPAQLANYHITSVL
jgi:hypothetical protein